MDVDWIEELEAVVVRAVVVVVAEGIVTLG